MSTSGEWRSTSVELLLVGAVNYSVEFKESFFIDGRTNIVYSFAVCFISMSCASLCSKYRPKQSAACTIGSCILFIWTLLRSTQSSGNCVKTPIRVVWNAARRMLFGFCCGTALMLRLASIVPAYNNNQTTVIVMFAGNHLFKLTSIENFVIGEVCWTHEWLLVSFFAACFWIFTAETHISCVRKRFSFQPVWWIFFLMGEGISIQQKVCLFWKVMEIRQQRKNQDAMPRSHKWNSDEWSAPQFLNWLRENSGAQCKPSPNKIRSE